MSSSDQGHPYRMDVSYWEWADGLPIHYGEMKFNDTASAPPTLLFQLAYDEFQVRTLRFCSSDATYIESFICSLSLWLPLLPAVLQPQRHG
jgi:hypothetical protein